MSEDDRQRSSSSKIKGGGRFDDRADRAHRITSQLFSLVDAVSDLVSATGDLVAQQLELARLELRQDIAAVIKRAVLAGAILVMLFFGYSLLLVAAILLVGWGWGIPGMAIATLVLAFVHLGITIPQARRLASRLGRPTGFKRSIKELENTKEWMSKQIESSSLKELEPAKKPSKSLSPKS